MSAKKPAMKRYAGRAKSRPDSRSPRRLPMAMRPMAITHNTAREGKSPGNTDVKAAMPADTLTATVSV
jgi:hypothetical protein